MHPLLRAAFTATMTLACFACAGEPPVDEESAAALTELERFTFDPSSTKEARGELDTLNAYWALRLAEVASVRAPDGSNSTEETRRALSAMGVPVRSLVSFHATENGATGERRFWTGTDGFYLRTDNAAFVVFRATEADDVGDMLASSRIRQVDVVVGDKKLGEAHSGFYKAFLAGWKNGLRRALGEQRTSGVPLYLVGHSLGGALATVAVPHVTMELGMPVRALYTYASPRVGDGYFVTNTVESLKRGGGQVFRFVSEQDFITTIPRFEPTVAIDGLVEPYRHLGLGDDERALAILVTRDGKLEAKPRARCAENPHLVQCDAHWPEVPSLIKDRENVARVHLSPHYLNAIRAAAARVKKPD